MEKHDWLHRMSAACTWCACRSAGQSGACLSEGPVRASTEVWKMPGVDREEKVMVLALYDSAGSLPMKLLIMLVLAVPAPPTSRVACMTQEMADN